MKSVTLKLNGESLDSFDTYDEKQYVNSYKELPRSYKMSIYNLIIGNCEIDYDEINKNSLHIMNNVLLVLESFNDDKCDSDDIYQIIDELDEVAIRGMEYLYTQRTKPIKNFTNEKLNRNKLAVNNFIRIISLMYDFTDSKNLNNSQDEKLNPLFDLMSHLSRDICGNIELEFKGIQNIFVERSNYGERILNFIELARTFALRKDSIESNGRHTRMSRISDNVQEQTNLLLNNTLNSVHRERQDRNRNEDGTKRCITKFKTVCHIFASFAGVIAENTMNKHISTTAKKLGLCFAIPVIIEEQGSYYKTSDKKTYLDNLSNKVIIIKNFNGKYSNMWEDKHHYSIINNTYPLLSDKTVFNNQLDHTVIKDFDNGLMDMIINVLYDLDKLIEVDEWESLKNLEYDSQLNYIKTVLNGRYHTDFRNGNESMAIAENSYDDESVELEDARSAVRTAVKKVKQVKKTADTIVEKVKAPIVKNLEDILSIGSNEAKNETEKKEIRENIKNGKYSVKFIVKKVFSHLGRKSIVVIIGGPIVGGIIAAMMTYVDIKQTKIKTANERRKMHKDLGDSIELVDIKINGADTEAQKLRYTKVKQQLTRAQGKVKYNDETIKSKGED